MILKKFISLLLSLALLLPAAGAFANDNQMTDEEFQAYYGYKRQSESDIKQFLQNIVYNDGHYNNKIILNSLILSTVVLAAVAGTIASEESVLERIAYGANIPASAAKSSKPLPIQEVLKKPEVKEAIKETFKQETKISKIESELSQQSMSRDNLYSKSKSKNISSQAVDKMKAEIKVKNAKIKELEMALEQLDSKNATIKDLEKKLERSIHAKTKIKVEAYGMVEDLIKEGKTLQSKLAARNNLLALQDDITKNILKLNSQLEAVEAAKTGAEAEKAVKAAMQTLQKLKAAKVPNATTQAMVKDFINSASKRLKGKGGAVGAALVTITAVIAFAMVSTDAQANIISNNRVAVQRILANTYKTTPELLTINAITLADKYGDDLVSSIIYEHQEEYMPPMLLSAEIAEMPEVQEYAKELEKEKNTFYGLDELKDWNTENILKEDIIQVPFR